MFVRLLCHDPTLSPDQLVRLINNIYINNNNNKIVKKEKEGNILFKISVFIYV